MKWQNVLGLHTKRHLRQITLQIHSKKCEIYSYEQDVFTDVDFMASAVTDREINSVSATSLVIGDITEDIALQIVNNNFNKSEDANVNSRSPEVLKGFPKAELCNKKINKRVRKRGKSIIATHTSEKKAIEERANKANKKSKLQASKI